MAGMPQKCFLSKPSCLEVHFTCLLIINFFPTDWSVVFGDGTLIRFLSGLFLVSLEWSHLVNWQFLGSKELAGVIPCFSSCVV